MAFSRTGGDNAHDAGTRRQPNPGQVDTTYLLCYPWGAEVIPPFNDRGELPPGMHDTTLHEIERTLGFNQKRRRMVQRLRRALRNLEGSGVRRVYLNGSFTTRKPEPKDIDGCWDADEHVRVESLDPVFLDFAQQRRAMKRKYGVDFFIANAIEMGSGVPFREFFQLNRDGFRKGLLVLDLDREELKR